MVLQNISLSVKDEFKLVCSVHGEGKLRWVDVYVCVHVRTCAYMCVHVCTCVYMCVHVCYSVGQWISSLGPVKSCW